MYQKTLNCTLNIKLFGPRKLVQCIRNTETSKCKYEYYKKKNPSFCKINFNNTVAISKHL